MVPRLLKRKAMQHIHRDFLKIVLSFFIAAFGIPSLSGVLSAAAAAFGYALFWSGILSLRGKNIPEVGGNCKTPFGAKFALFPLDSTFCKVPMANRICHFAKNRTNEKIIKFCSRSELCNSLVGVVIFWFAGVQAIQLNWMISLEYMGPGILVVYFFVILALGLQFALLTHCIRLPMTWLQIVGLSGFWVLMEWVRLFFLTGFPWNPIGLTLAASSYSIQMASLVGVYGLCFWVVFVNLLLLKNPFSKAWIVFALLPYGYGIVHQYILKRALPPGKELSVALVQTALRPEQRDYFPSKPAEHLAPLIQWDLILSYFANLHKDRFDLIVLSEGAVPNGPWQAKYPFASTQAIWQRHFGQKALSAFPLGDEKRVSNGFLIQALANHFQAEVIAGLDDREGNRVYNAAFHFSPKTLSALPNPINRYHKQILIPLGEYMPFQEWKWLSDFSAETFGIPSSFSPGNEVKIFPGIVPVGVFICLEEAYSQFVREIRRQGAELFVNLTNDVWFPESRFPWHHFDHGRLRAVENGVCLLRATNTGVTAAIDCFGDPLAIFPPSEKNAGILDVNIATRSYSTIYTFLGDVPVLVVSGFFLALLTLDRMLRKKKLL